MKKFILCVCVALMCSNLNASIDYKNNYEISHRYRQRKSVGKIIREILNRKGIEKKSDTPNTIPMPLYDGIHPDTIKDLA